MKLVIYLQFIIGTLFLFPANFAAAQIAAPTVINSTGGSLEAIDNSYKMDYSVGEVVINTLFDMNYVFTQGFIQPDSVLITVPVNDLQPEGWDVNVFPNPTPGNLFIQITEKNPGEELSMTIWNVSGQLLSQRLSLGDIGQYELDLYHLASGTYFINLENQSAQSFTFKFIKL